MNSFINWLRDQNIKYTKTNNHNKDMWIIDYCNQNVLLYFDIEGKFCYDYNY